MHVRWHKPSLAGRRLALDRKWRINVGHYGGPVKLLTVTPLGQDVLPYGDETRPFGKLPNVEQVPQVEWIYREVFNGTAAQRFSRLSEAAQRAADRWVRRQGYEGRLPRQVGNARAFQKRGLLHFHVLLPYATALEQSWARLVHRFTDNAWRRDLERFGPEGIFDQLWREYHGETPARGFYGFGFVNARNPAGRSAEKSASYMARNSAAPYLAQQGGGHYVSARLTRETGVTMRALRAVNFLYVRRKMIAAGELDDEEMPFWWSPEWRETVLGVQALCARAP
jgi:hypothetical protein